jgi:phage gpG-like protein
MSFSITGLQSLKKRVADIRERIANPRPGLTRAALVVLKAARERIKSGGPGWAPNVTGTPLLFKTGRLINSLTLGGPGNEADYNGNSMTVGTNLPYARYLQEGTGVYGPTGRRIVPKSGKVLAFTINGVPVYARSVEGMPPRPFLYVTDEIRQQARAVYGRYIMGSEDNSET